MKSANEWAQEICNIMIIPMRGRYMEGLVQRIQEDVIASLKKRDEERGKEESQE